MTASKTSEGPVVLYIKLLLFLYTMFSPFLLRTSGVASDPKKRAVASAFGCVAIALGAGIAIYGTRDGPVLALGVLTLLSGLSTVLVLRGNRGGWGPATGLGAGAGGVETLVIDDAPISRPEGPTSATDPGRRRQPSDEPSELAAGKYEHVFVHLMIWGGGGGGAGT
jgi:hypothetical protein